MQLKRKSFYLFSFAAEVGAVMEEKTPAQMCVFILQEEGFMWENNSFA